MSHLSVIRAAFQTKLEQESTRAQGRLKAMRPGEIRAACIYAESHGLMPPDRQAQWEAADAALDAAIDAARRANISTPMQIQAALRRAGIVVVDGLPALRASGRR